MKNQRSGSRRRRRFGRAVIVFLYCSILAVVSIPAFGIVVEFLDPGLEIAIRSAIGRPAADIDDTDLAELVELDASNQGIINLDGIEYCSNLMMLFLNDSQISDITPLSRLTELTDLGLNGNQISDMVHNSNKVQRSASC